MLGPERRGEAERPAEPKRPRHGVGPGSPWKPPRGAQKGFCGCNDIRGDSAATQATRQAGPLGWLGGASGELAPVLAVFLPVTSPVCPHSQHPQA